tara:strand:+ start:335 stop:796 length:462 start_codon:yes stop_codon:yes gene_type:complete
MHKNGMIIALMDEYTKSTIELKKICSKLPQSDFEQIRDSNATDKDCKSIQTVICHVVQSGYTYANYINGLFNIEWKEYDLKVNMPKQGITELNIMLDFSEKALNQLHSKSQNQIEEYSIKSRWGVTYDIEQLIEHAIVHILRHRRQIENFLRN